MEKVNKNQKVIEKAKKSVSLFPIQDLIDNCEALTKHKKHVVVGALFNCKKTEMSKDEFIETVESFLKRSVK